MTDRPLSASGASPPSKGSGGGRRGKTEKSGGRSPEDRVLVRQALDGESQAFGQLFDRYVRLVHSVCYDTTGRTEDARDLVQDVFMRSYRNLAQLREPDRFASWLLAISHRTCRDWIRRKMRDRHEFLGTDPGSNANVNASANAGVKAEGAEVDEDLDRLRHAMQTLPDNERLALHLFYLEDQPVEAARKVLGLSRSGFYRVLERSRERLREILGPDAV